MRLNIHTIRQILFYLFYFYTLTQEQIIKLQFIVILQYKLIDLTISDHCQFG